MILVVLLWSSTAVAEEIVYSYDPKNSAQVEIERCITNAQDGVTLEKHKGTSGFDSRYRNELIRTLGTKETCSLSNSYDSWEYTYEVTCTCTPLKLN